VAVTADTIELRGGGASGAISSSTRGEGNAGGVAVTADTIEIRDGGHISSSTRGPGTGGEVTVNAGQLRIDGTGSGSEVFTGIISQAETDSTGNAGRVAVTADTIDIHGDGDSSDNSHDGLSTSTGTVNLSAENRAGWDAAGAMRPPRHR
jgi:hypothetical protein